MKKAGSSVLPTLPGQGDRLGEGGFDESVDGDIRRNTGKGKVSRTAAKSPCKVPGHRVS